VNSMSVYEEPGSTATIIDHVVREHLALNEQELIDWVVDLQLDNRMLQDTLSAALEGLYHVTVERNQERGQRLRIVEEYRPHRQRVMAADLRVRTVSSSEAA